jgi:hypothetical protein
MLAGNIKTDHRGVRYEASDWIYVAESRLLRWALLNILRNHKIFHIKACNTLSTCF